MIFSLVVPIAFVSNNGGAFAHITSPEFDLISKSRPALSPEHVPIVNAPVKEHERCRIGCEQSVYYRRGNDRWNSCLSRSEMLGGHEHNIRSIGLINRSLEGQSSAKGNIHWPVVYPTGAIAKVSNSEGQLKRGWRGSDAVDFHLIHPQLSALIAHEGIGIQLSGFGGIPGGLGGFRRYALRSIQKTDLKNRDDAKSDGRQSKPKSEDRNGIREHEPNEPTQRMLFFALVFCLGLSGGLLFAWLTGRWR